MNPTPVNRLFVSPIQSNTPVLANQTINSSNGGVPIDLNPCGGVTLNINLKGAPLGTNPTVAFTIKEVDPVDGVTPINSNSVTGAALSTQGATQQLTLTDITSNCVLVSWVVTGTFPVFPNVNVSVTPNISQATAIISGTVETIDPYSVPATPDAFGSAASHLALNVAGHFRGFSETFKNFLTPSETIYLWVRNDNASTIATSSPVGTHNGVQDQVFELSYGDRSIYPGQLSVAMSTGVLWGMSYSATVFTPYETPSNVVGSLYTDNSTI